MKSFALPFLIAVVGVSGRAQISPAAPPLGGVQAPTPAPSKPVAPETVVAEVDGKKYTAADVDKLFSMFPPQTMAAAQANPKQALSYILTMQALAAEAQKSKLDKQSPLKEQIEYARIMALSQAEINDVRNLQVKVELEDEQKFYNEHPERFEVAKVKVIYVAFTAANTAGKKTLSEPEAKAKIEDLRKQAQGGADFGKLAKENSDDKDSAAKNGDFPDIKRTSPYPEDIKKAVFALKPGQISDPIRQPNGFYLVRLESKTTEPYDKVRTQIYEELKQKGFNEYMQGLQKRFDVKVENTAYFAPKSPGPVTPPAH